MKACAAPMLREVKSFAQDTLGCACPDEVFESIAVDTQLADFTGLPVAHTLDIGRRLLIVITAGEPASTAQAMSRILRAGISVRDAQGFNRLRLVVAAVDPAERDSLQTAFDATPGRDEKVHLHFVVQADLPGLP